VWGGFGKSRIPTRPVAPDYDNACAESDGKYPLTATEFSAALLRLRRRQMFRAAEGLEDLARAAMPEVVRETNPAQLGLRDVELDLPAHDVLACDVADEAMQYAPVVRRHCQRADRNLAPAF
jgi:hypothetical protein